MNKPQSNGAEPLIVCEELFELFGTTSETIRKQQEEKDAILLRQANSALRQANERADSLKRSAELAEQKAKRYRDQLIALGVAVEG